MKTLVFTICARNYVGLSKVLGNSIARHGPSADFRIYVADGLGDHAPTDGTLVSAPEALEAIIPADEFANMAFMYNITEFCTALKAACFIHAFADGYERCVYMDPDTFLVADFGHVTEELEQGCILITPHLCVPALNDGPRSDQGILATGVYNLGFLGLRQSEETQRFLRWWHQRLRSQAFNDHYHALFTDQRWIDFVPSLFPAPAVRVWRHIGCNVAPWNYHERRITRQGDSFLVTPRGADSEPPVPLVFLHFSGFDFRGILDGKFDQLNLQDAESYDDVLPLYEIYGEAIRAEADEMARCLAIPYAFDSYSDGTAILPTQRRLFRIWRERHGNAAAPFATGRGTFHAALAERGLLGRPGKSDLIADKATARSVANPGRLLASAHLLFRLIFQLVGRRRFFLLVRGLNRLAHVEQHYDTFRLDTASVVAAAPKKPEPVR